MRPVNPQPTVLLVENYPDLLELEELVLSEAGFQVVPLPKDVPPVASTEQIHPHVIVVHLDPWRQVGLDLIDQLQMNPTTREIPVVVIANAQQTAGQAQAGANVTRVVVAPYDIEALEGAVARALGNPPLAATIPAQTGPVPAALRVAGEALTQNTREIALHSVEALRNVEPFRSRFQELSVGLVDELGVLLGAIAAGLERGLRPVVVFSSPKVQQRIAEHLRVRRQEGVELDAVLGEVHALEHQVETFFQGLEGQDGFTAQDAREADRALQEYFNALAQMMSGLSGR